jgi:hypothetical protein
MANLIQFLMVNSTKIQSSIEPVTLLGADPSSLNTPAIRDLNIVSRGRPTVASGRTLYSVWLLVFAHLPD